MTPAWLSLAALVGAVAVGAVRRVNVGLVAIALAYLVGVGVGGLTPAQVTAGFPSQLFLVLAAVTLLFAQAEVNGTLERLAQRGIRLARGNPGVVPILFFGLGLLLSTLGAGSIAATALVAPVAMTAAARLGISGFLMTIMVANGCNAGSLSPIAPTGIVANQLMGKAGIAGVEWWTYWSSLAAQTAVAIAGYCAFGGLRLLRRRGSPDSAAHATDLASSPPAELPPLSRDQWLTIGVLLALLIGVLALELDLVMGAFMGVVALLLLRVADEAAAIRAVPWGTILLVCGISTLVAVLEKTGALGVVVDLLARVSTPLTVTGIVAFVAGVVSAYSSTIGVVLPTFLPMVPSLAERVGADPLMIASSINVGGSLVDVSPLSTIGALCIAAAAGTENRQALFNQVLAWGLSMAVVGALVCWVFFGLLGR
jgi:di/tricarboxylate transporter